ncbi:MAG: hypothetical protein H0Z28_01420 [Archaeoglobus sp.]|nr:hypothetical protein [Archaeoglobus sp.]
MKKKAKLIAIIFILLMSSLMLGCVKKEEPREEVKLSFEPKILVFETESGWRVNVLMALPTPCHKVEYVGKQTKGNEYYLDFTYKKPENPCAQVITNYNQTIDLGELKKGEYTIILRFNGQEVKRATFRVN